MTEELLPLLSRHKTKPAYCKITNRMCYAASQRSSKPMPSTKEKICKSKCPWGMKWQSNRRTSHRRKKRTD